MKSPEMINLGLTALDDLFATAQDREENKLPQIHNIPISEIDDFESHPFQIHEEDLLPLVTSVREYGIITPVVLRKKDDGRYEMISGHRRKRACEIIGLDTIPAEIKLLSRDEAIIEMVESNFQRSKILPSEKAKSYRMWVEAHKRQGKRNDLTSDPLDGELDNEETAAIAGKYFGDSATQVRRYIRLNNLIEGLLIKVDAGEIGLRPAVELSDLHPKNQEFLLDKIEELGGVTPSLSQAQRLKKAKKDKKDILDEDLISSIMQERKPNQREKIGLHIDRIESYIPEGYTPQKMEDYIVSVLESAKNEAAKNEGKMFSIQRERIAPFLPKDGSPEKMEEYILQALHHYHHYRQRQRQNDAR